MSEVSVTDSLFSKSHSTVRKIEIPKITKRHFQRPVFSKPNFFLI